MCIRDRVRPAPAVLALAEKVDLADLPVVPGRLVLGMESESLAPYTTDSQGTVSYTHLRAHETVLDLVCRLLLEKKKHTSPSPCPILIYT